MKYSGALVDLDGTVYHGDTTIPGAPAGIDHLREAGLDVLFCSNNATRSRETYVDHLAAFGIDATVERICTAGTVTTTYLRENHADDDICLVGSTGLREQLQDAGLELTDDPEQVDVLVASCTDEFDYTDMQTALDAVDEETPFLGTNRDRTLPGDDGSPVPGSGSIIFSLAATVGRDPDAMLGKPSEWMAEAALARLGVPAEECLMIGDRLDTDLAMGEQTEMTTVLVLSGVSDRADVAESDVSPDYVIDSLAEIETVLETLDA